MYVTVYETFSERFYGPFGLLAVPTGLTGQTSLETNENIFAMFCKLFKSFQKGNGSHRYLTFVSYETNVRFPASHLTNVKRM